MKKIIFAIAIILTIGFTARAQGTDGFFDNWNEENGNRATENVLPVIPGGTVGSLDGNQEAPLGSGLLILTAFGAGYVVARKRKEE